jgi:methylmalonyl-CoA mutase, N-terminal domain
MTASQVEQPTKAESPTPPSPKAEFRAESGFEFDAVYGPESAAGTNSAEQLGAPGEYPYTRGVYPNMYRGRPWTIREYAGFGSALETSRRFQNLIEEGGTGLSVAFDLPTQMGYDSDHPLARGEVGRVGVAIDSLADMRALFDGISLDKVSTSMTINAPAALLLLMYQLVAEEQGADVRRLAGTIQNDILKEYIARGTYIFPPRPSLRLTTDIFAYCRRELPRWNSISISGYHMAEAGANPAQEIAFTFSNAMEYVRAAIAGGLAVDEFAPRVSFFFVARITVLEEVAKFRAARRLWARIMRDRFEATDPHSMRLRFHTQTAGVQLTAQQPEVNLIRVTLAALAAVLGGTQSLHTNSYDEAIALPTDHAARLAVRTQQVLEYETDIPRIVDALGGSYAIERLTDQIEEEAEAIIDRIEAVGGAAAAIEQRLQTAEIDQSAYRVTRETESGQRIIVGMNRFQIDEEEPYERLRTDERIEPEQIERLKAVRAARDSRAVTEALEAVTAAAIGTDNLLYPIKQALVVGGTVGEICGALRAVWGTYDAEMA